MPNPSVPTSAAVMVGSTVAGLPAHRKAALDAVWRCGLTPILVIAGDPALPSLVEQCAAYLTIVSSERDNTPSIVEEYRLATGRGLPALIFHAPTTQPSFGRPDEWTPYQSVPQLGSEIARRLSLLLPPAEGASPLLIGIPEQPAPYLAHPHYMGRRLIGRSAELAQIERWYTTTDPLLVIDGVGGVGKSALLWHWALSMAERHSRVGLMVWNFADLDGGFENFVCHAWAYFTQQPLPPYDPTRISERLRDLTRYLNENPALLLLDGVDRLLTMSAPPHAELQRAPAADSDWQRAFAGPEIEAFFDALAKSGSTKTIISCRWLPSSLQPAPNMPREGVYRLALEGLDTHDTLALMSASGVQAKAEGLADLAQALGSTPLLISLVCGRIAGYKDSVTQWLQDTAHGWHILRLASAEPAERISGLVAYAMSDISLEQTSVLYTLSALRQSADWPTLYALSPYHVERPNVSNEPRRVQPANEDQKTAYENMQREMRDFPSRYADSVGRVHTALSDLEARGLLQWDRATNRYTVHALVRIGVTARWANDARQTIFSRIRRHFEKQMPELLQVQSPSALNPALEVYNALMGSGLLDEAARFYRDALSRPLLSRFADYRLVVNLLMPMFKNGPSSLPALGSRKDQSYFANEMALALGNLGQKKEAQALLGESFRPFIDENESTRLCVALINYSGMLENQLALRVRLFEMARKLATAVDDMENLAICNFYLLRTYADMGQWQAAEEAYIAFGQSAARYRTTTRQSAAERAIARMLLAQGQDPTNTLNLAWELGLQSQSQTEQRAIHSLWGEAALHQLNRADAAERFFEEALRMTEPGQPAAAQYRGGLARAYALQGRAEDARALLEQGVPSLAAAHVYQTLGAKDQAIAAALDAYRQAWGDGPPFILWWDLEQSRAILSELKVSEPVLKPFALSSLPPVPHEAEIRAYISRLERAKSPLGEMGASQEGR